MQVLNEQEVAQNVQKIAQDVREAALQAGRDPSEVQVMAVTKTVDPVLVNAAIGAGALGFLLAMGSMGGLANGLVTGTLSGSFGVELAAFLPFAWPSRLASLTVELAVAGRLGAAGQEGVLVASLSQVAIACAALTAAFAAVSLARANRYEDKRRAGE